MKLYNTFKSLILEVASIDSIVDAIKNKDKIIIYLGNIFYIINPRIFGDSFHNNKDVIVIKNNFIKILGNFFKSKTFTNYYVYYYKPSIGGPVVIDFMNKHFGV